MNYIGTWMLRFSFACGLIAFLLIVSKKENKESKNLGILTGMVSCGGVLTSAALLIYSLVKGIYSVEYVYHNTEKSLPLVYKISAFWSGSAGSMLLWTSVFAVLLIIIYLKNKDKKSTKTVFGVVLFVMTLFMFVVTFISNPFKQVSTQSDGFGLNPSLQSLGMVFHPPIIIVSFSFFFIAFGYQLCDLRRDVDENEFISWKWAIWGWMLLTAGIVTGGIWAYTELGWGGYWAWDAIENSSLVNWLFATIFLHGLSRKGTGNKRRRNFTLIFMTVFTMLVGTYFARSGLLKSVHAYSSQGVTIVFGAVLLLLLILFIFYRLRVKRLNADNIESKKEEAGSSMKKILTVLTTPDSIFTALCIATIILIFGGTVFPLFGGIFSKDASMVPTAFFEYTFGVFGILTLMFLAICPKLISKKVLMIPGIVCGLTVLILMILLSKYGLMTKLSLAVCAMLAVNLVIGIAVNYKKVVSDPRYVAFLILHAAIIIMAVGFAGSRGMLISSDEILKKNDTVTVGGYEVKYRNLYWKEEAGKTTAVAVIGVNGSKGRLQLKPELSYYQKMKISHSRAVIKSGLNEDLYIIFEGIDESDNITLKVMVLKWVSLVWIGSALLITGALLLFIFKNKNQKKVLI